MFKPSLSFPSIRLEVPLWSEHLAVIALIALLKSNPCSLLRRLPTALSFSGIPQCPFQKEEFAVISRYFNSRYRDCAPNLSVKVPNRGVDWSSRPRRACYPWGNFSVTSGPQQWGLEGSLGHTFVAENSAFKFPVRPGFSPCRQHWSSSRYEQSDNFALIPSDVFSPVCLSSSEPIFCVRLPLFRTLMMALFWCL